MSNIEIKRWLLHWKDGKWYNFFDVNYCASLRTFLSIEQAHENEQLAKESQDSIVTGKENGNPKLPSVQ